MGRRGGGNGAARIRSADDELTVNVLGSETIELERSVDFRSRVCVQLVYVCGPAGRQPRDSTL